MSRTASIRSAARGTLSIGLAACLAVGAGSAVAVAQDASRSPAASAPVSSAEPLPSGEAAEPSPVSFPLPEIVAAIPPDIPTVSLEPESAPGSAEVGEPIPFSLGHCGLLSPVDLDGSLWQPVSGTDAAGGPIDGDDEVGELINATAGEMTLNSPDTAEFRTLLGSVIVLARAPGALEYPLCM